MQWLAAICVKRPVFASVLVLVFVVVGMIGYSRLPLDRFPKVDFPVVVVTTRVPGATPAEMESQVTNKIEEAVNTISGIDELSSTSSESVSVVAITFVLEKPVDTATQEVRDRISRILPDLQLPEGADLPVVEKLDPDAEPVIDLAIQAERPVREITEYADKVIKRQIENIAGVGQVTLLGGHKRQINVRLDPVRLRAFGLTSLDVQMAIKRQHIQIPAGSVKNSTREINLRVEGKTTTVDELARIVVRQAAGSVIRLRDVAEVEDGEDETRSLALRNGVPAVVLSIRKQSGENTVAVVDAVHERVAELQGRLPAGYRIDTVRDNSLVIRTSTGAVKEHLILGAIFAALVVLFFLGNGRATLIAALAIPTSIIASFGVMWANNVTLNQISLIALALAVGIVIDDAIIVVENIFRHIKVKKESPHDAAISATREIGLAVMSTTMSLLAVFVPVAFLSGIVGRFMRDFGLTMAFAIAVSLLMSFTLAPMLSARILVARRPGRIERALEKIVNSFYKPLEALYMVMLRAAMRWRWAVVLLAIAVFASSVWTVKFIRMDFVPATEEAQFNVTLRLPEGTSIEATGLVAERVAGEIRRLPGVLATFMTIGNDSQRTQNAANIYVSLTDPVARSQSQLELMDRVRREIVPHYPREWRLAVLVVPPFNTGQSSANIQYMVSGPDLAYLSQVATESLAEMRKVEGIRDIDSSYIPGKPELAVLPDRSKAGQLDVAVSDLTAALRLLVGGDKVSSFSESGEDYDIHVRAIEGYRNNRSALDLLSVPSPHGPVPLANVVRFESREGPSQINHRNRARMLVITANNAPGVGEDRITAEVKRILDARNLPPGYQAAPFGRTKEMKRMQDAFLTAFGLAFVFMYLILAAQFESWIHPFTILLAFPLTIPFALLSLLIFNQSLNLFSILGMFVLFGMVKKNGILQIDHTIQLRAAGMQRLDAILQANRDRLRPILMTTVSFVAGMIPLLLSKGIGAAMNTATAGVIIGGQTLSLLLTLLATPVFYSLFDDASDLSKKLARKLASLRGGAVAEVATPPVEP